MGFPCRDERHASGLPSIGGWFPAGCRPPCAPPPGRCGRLHVVPHQVAEDPVFRPVGTAISSRGALPSARALEPASQPQLAGLHGLECLPVLAAFPCCRLGRIRRLGVQGGVGLPRTAKPDAPSAESSGGETARIPPVSKVSDRRLRAARSRNYSPRRIYGHSPGLLEA
jgi:hypothetical protein